MTLQWREVHEMLLNVEFGESGGANEKERKPANCIDKAIVKGKPAPVDGRKEHSKNYRQ